MPRSIVVGTVRKVQKSGWGQSNLLVPRDIVTLTQVQRPEFDGGHICEQLCGNHLNLHLITEKSTGAPGDRLCNCSVLWSAAAGWWLFQVRLYKCRCELAPFTTRARDVRISQ